MLKKETAEYLRKLTITLMYLLIVVVAWGTNYPLIKLAIEDIEPLTFSLVRLVGGSLTVYILLLLVKSNHILPYKGERVSLTIIGILQIVSVLGLASVALLYLPAGRTVTLIYSMPFWAALFDVLIMRNKPSIFQFIGMIASFTGLLLFLNPSVIQWQQTGVTVGVSITVLAAALWGLGTVLYRYWNFKTPMLNQTLWQLFTASIIMFFVAAAIEFPTKPNITWQLVIILLWNWVIPTALAVWSWTKLLNLLPGSIAGQLLMSTPFVGIAFSAFIFDEQLSPEFTISAILISIGGILAMIRRSK